MSFSPVSHAHTSTVQTSRATTLPTVPTGLCTVRVGGHERRHVALRDDGTGFMPPSPANLTLPSTVS